MSDKFVYSPHHLSAAQTIDIIREVSRNTPSEHGKMFLNWVKMLDLASQVRILLPGVQPLRGNNAFPTASAISLEPLSFSFTQLRAWWLFHLV